MGIPTASSNRSATHPVLYMAMELSSKTWTLGFSAGGKTPRLRDVPARGVKELVEEIRKAKRRFGLPEDARVVSCYEAGRDAFWLHRQLECLGVHSLVVDSSSIEVNRRARRAKTDRLDARKLLQQLIRYDRGEVDVWSVVNAPSVEDEDARRPHRELERLKKERTQHRSRVRALLANQGVTLSGCLEKALADLDSIRLWNGGPLPPLLLAELRREAKRLELVDAHIREIETQLKQSAKEPKTAAEKMVVALSNVRGVGLRSARVLVMEFFAWRDFLNRKQVGGCAGLTGTPYDSGSSSWDQGISKSGNARVRTLMIELAWFWLRYQPQTALSRWWKEKFGEGSSRLRRVGVVALARKLLIAFWRLLAIGEVPEGAILKA